MLSERGNNDEAVLQGPCPVCGALIVYSASADPTCPHCEHSLVRATTYPTGHFLAEIDPRSQVRRHGQLQFDLHPQGTKTCAVCRLIYPKGFEVCPGLVDLALRSYRSQTDEHRLTTDQCIEEFLRQDKLAIRNTIQLLVSQYQCGQMKSEEFAPIRATIEAIGLASIDE